MDGLCGMHAGRLLISDAIVPSTCLQQQQQRCGCTLHVRTNLLIRSAAAAAAATATAMMTRPARPAAALLVVMLMAAVLHVAAAGMVRAEGTRFAVDGGGTVYFSGFNAYWLMLTASDPSRRGKVVTAFRQASAHGLNLARTWAFSDGGDRPLQSSPGVYDEAMFKGLDFVVAEASRHGIYLLLCLTNNFDDFGGKRQYVQWARDAGHDNLTTADDFFNSTLVKAYYKNHVRTVLTRVNTVTGVAYKDDPAIFAWELMNEPRCDADPAGGMVQAWVEEMAPYVKSVDGEHLVTAGLEGFYGDGAHENRELNPWGIYYGTNFVATHQAPGIDFATIHLYPDVWLWGSTADEQLRFFRNWTQSHIRDTEERLRKPLLVTEYGKFLWDDEDANATRISRNYFLDMVLDSIYASASRGRPLVGGAFWQLLDDGMDTLRDGYEIILPEDTRAATIISSHSEQLAELNGQDAALRRRSTSPRKMGSSGARDTSTSAIDPHVDRSLIRFVSLFRSISSLFGSTISHFYAPSFSKSSVSC